MKNPFYFTWGVRLVALFILGSLIVMAYRHQLTQPEIVPGQSSTLTFPNGHVINLEFATDDATRTQGLSDRQSLPLDEGMLFIFPEESYHPFWMPNMNFSLDIIWLDSNYHITDIQKEAPPLMSGMVNPFAYINTRPAKYVLEVNAGVADANYLVIGDVLKYRHS